LSITSFYNVYDTTVLHIIVQGTDTVGWATGRACGGSGL